MPPRYSSHTVRALVDLFHAAPYPTMTEKSALAVEHGLTLQQVNTWFMNARKRGMDPDIFLTPDNQKQSEKVTEKNTEKVPEKVPEKVKESIFQIDREMLPFDQEDFDNVPTPLDRCNMLRMLRRTSTWRQLHFLLLHPSPSTSGGEGGGGEDKKDEDDKKDEEEEVWEEWKNACISVVMNNSDEHVRLLLHLALDRQRWKLATLLRDTFVSYRFLFPS